MADPWQSDDRRTVEIYTELVQKYGDDVRALNWGSKRSQELRFRVLSEVGDLAGASVLDVGCGTGDFYGWLRKTGWQGRYAGIDITPGMIDVARSRFPDAEFTVGDLLKQEVAEVAKEYDFVFASGIFTYRKTEPAAYLREMVVAMFARCRRAVAFNSLSSWAPVPALEEFFADPLETIAFCRSLSDRLVLRHDYHPNDFTVYVHRAIA
jgi:SAM-dependent methyltransferase